MARSRKERYEELRAKRLQNVAAGVSTRVDIARALADSEVDPAEFARLESGAAYATSAGSDLATIMSTAGEKLDKARRASGSKQ